MKALRPIRSQVQYLKRVGRALRGKDLLLPIQLKCPKVILGCEGASWCVCPESLSSQSVVYSFGVGSDISFDRALIQRYGVTVHAFDPTPRSIQWLRTQTLPSNFIFHDYGIAEYDGVASFSPPANRNFVSYSMIDNGGTENAASGKVYRLSTIMENLKHTSIDLIKMDIEGAEYNVLRDILESRIPVRQLLIEFHHRWNNVGIEKTKAAVRELNRAGYRIFDVSNSGEDYGFLKA